MKSFSGAGPAPRLIKMLASAGNTEVRTQSLFLKCCALHFPQMFSRFWIIFFFAFVLVFEFFNIYLHSSCSRILHVLAI